MKRLDFSTQTDFSQFNPKNNWEKEIIQFWKEWKSPVPSITVQTSGSTGSPKTITLPKKNILASAKMTCEFFNLQKHDSALLCLPAQYIAAKMMLVRAEWAGLRLYCVEPKLSISIDQTIDFAAMTPAQCQKSLQSLEFINTLILGGSRVNEKLKSDLKNYSTQVFETYGMTETLSHIALKDLQKHNALFEPMNGIHIQQSQEGTLIIDAPQLTDKRIETNDLVTINKNGHFLVHGRTDNVVNSGGKKISVEPLEEKITQVLGRSVILYGKEDEILGERLILLIEGDEHIQLELLDSIGFSKHEKPKEIYFTDQFERSNSGKILRKESIKKYE